MMKKRLLTTALITIMYLISNSQTGNIQGTITIGNNQPAAFISIGIKGNGTGTISGQDGAYLLQDAPAGEQVLVIAFPRYRTVEVSVNVVAGKTTKVPAILLQATQVNLHELVITGVQNLNDKTVSMGKADIKPMDLPQSVSMVERKLMDQQQAQTMSDVLKNFNGVYIMGSVGGVQQEIAARGFAFSSNNTFKNGVRFNNAVMPEMSALERVEVMKGSNAILFGNVSAGGVINLITRKPTFTTGGEITFRGESYGFYKPAVDIYGVVDKQKKVAFRLNSVYENAGSFRDNVHSDRVYFNPSVMMKAGKKTDILIEADYLRDNRTCDFGIGTINYVLIDLPRNRFIGAKWSHYNTEQRSATTTLTHRLNTKWQLKAVASVQTFSNDLFSTMRPNNNNEHIMESGKWIRGVQRTVIDETYYLGQVDLTGKFTTGILKHNLLVGADIDQYRTYKTAYNNLDRYDSVNVFDLSMYQQRNDIPDLSKNTITSSPINRTGMYVQDLVSLSNHFKLLAGVRFSYLETGSRVLTYANDKTVSNKQYDFATTPRLGLVYQPTSKVSVFTSYANSFAPNTGVDINGKSLSPSYTTQYEGGVKTNLLRDALSANITAYQIVNSNLAQTNLANGNTNTNIKELAGEVTSEGIEADIMSKSLHGFVIVAGYSYNKTRYTRSNTYVVGSLLRYNPTHTANTSLYYTINSGTLKGLILGLSSQYFGKRMAGRSTRVTVENDPYRLIALPAYTLLDASLGYARNKMGVRLKVSNITNALSYNVHDDNSVNPIAPRQVAATVSYKF
jgi:iron complex outermembrane receptor protein